MKSASIEPRLERLPDGRKFEARVARIGKATGWPELAVRLSVDPATGLATMTSAWEPTPAELAALNAGANVHVVLLGVPSHPPISVTVGDPPKDDAE